MFHRDTPRAPAIGLASLDWPKPMPAPQPAVTMAYRILAINAAHAPMVPEWAALVADAQSIIAAHARAAGV